MKVFIIWSGKRSQRVAKALRTFLQDVNQRIEPWMSETDIEKGSRWATQLANELEETQFGIACITYEALESPWILFEAGAISKSEKNARLCPYLIGIKKDELRDPIALFHCADANEEDTYELLKSINQTMGTQGLTSERLRKYFNKFWPDLKSAIDAVSNTSFLSPTLHDDLMDILIRCLSFEEFRGYFHSFGLPYSRVNWKQAYFNVCHEVITELFDAGKLSDFLKYVAKERPDIDGLQDLVKRLSKRDKP